jgi:Carboxypeptidase regulatory-like domain
VDSRSLKRHSQVAGQDARKGRPIWVRRAGFVWLIVFTFCFLVSPTLSRAKELLAAGAEGDSRPDTRGTSAGFPQQSSVPQDPGTIRGTVLDTTGAPVAGARVKLLREGSLTTQESVSDEEGQFRFVDIPPGPFQITMTAEGFKTNQFTGTLGAGQNYLVPAMALFVAGGSTEVQVSMTRTEIAEAEIRDEEKQRVLGVVPNFYVTYNPAAVPLTVKQKFELAWKATIDPVNFGLNGATAGIEQATDAFSGYGQGAQGYAKRYGASYADLVTGTFIGSAVLPALLKQDPRYFYKGTGTRKSRVLYALANAVICKGDNGRWQPNYSAILGGIAAGGLSNLYYPSSDRGAGLVFENALIGVGTTAAANILQEFVIRKLTPHAPSYAPVTVTP